MPETARTRRRSRAVEDIHWGQVGHRIRELRGLYITQAEFASRVGVSQSFLSTVEHGKVEVGAAILLRISREFGRSIEWLLTGKEFVPDR